MQESARIPVRGLSHAIAALVAAGFWLTPAPAAQPDYREVRSTPFLLPPENVAVAVRAASGDFYFLARQSGAVYRYSGSGEFLNVFRVSSITEISAGQFYLQPDLAVDRTGNVYCLGLFRPDGGQLQTVALIFNPQGVYQKMVITTPRVEARRIAVDADGSIYLVGVDPAYFRSTATPCLLLHKYTPDGRRIAAFSECPAGLRLRGAGASPGPDLPVLLTECERGRVWIQTNSIFHALPRSHLVRQFDSAGKLVREAVLDRPKLAPSGPPVNPPGAGEDLAWRVMSTRSGRFLVEWQHADVAEGRRRNQRLLSIHDVGGGLVTQGVPPADGRAWLFSDDAGYCYAVRKKGASRNAELLQIDVGLN